MTRYLKFGIIYFLAAIVVQIVARGDPSSSLQMAWGLLGVLLAPMAKYLAAILIIAAGWAAIKRPGSVVSIMAAVLAAMAGTIFFHTGFSLVKSSLPEILPFFADHFFADIDAWLHGGRDAWKVFRDLPVDLSMANADLIYLGVWTIPAVCLPAIVAGIDRDAARVRRTIFLYLIGWLLLGNLLALLGMSAGPVYYDRLYGGERFAELTGYLATSGFAETRMGFVQASLWSAYSDESNAFGSLISAFPSVHVGVATVTAIYLYERSRWLLIVGAPFVLAVFFISVLSGYHYAVDGYASAAIILVVWRWLLARDVKNAPEKSSQLGAKAVPAE